MFNVFFLLSPPPPDPPIYFFFLLLVVKLEPYQHIKTLCKRDIRMRIQLDTFDSGLNVTAADPTVCNRVRKHTAPVVWQREFIKCQQLKRLGSRWSLKVSVFTQNHANKGRWGGRGGCFLNSLTDIWNSQAWGKHYKFISCQLDVALELLNAEPKKITSEWTQRWGLWTAIFIGHMWNDKSLVSVNLNFIYNSTIHYNFTQSALHWRTVNVWIWNNENAHDIRCFVLGANEMIWVLE